MKPIVIYGLIVFCLASQPINAFPEREFVQINPLAINFSGGGLHCNTKKIPMLKDH